MPDEKTGRSRSANSRTMEFEPHDNHPERNLISATLERAILDLSSRELKTKRDANSWLFESKSTAPFSFRWCCLQMDWDLEVMRNGIKALGTPSSIDQLYSYHYKKVRRLHG